MPDLKDSPIPLFHPHIPASAAQAVAATLAGRWIGQGPQVDLFETAFAKRFCRGRRAVAVGSGTDALHLAYILAGLKPGDEVIAPAFTCVATNIPLLYLGVKIRFADVQPGTLNIDPSHVSKLVNEKTRAIVCVHYGGLPCDMAELRAIARDRRIPIIEDAAQALGASYGAKPVGSISEFTAFSFQAVKHITTGDGGLLAVKGGAAARKAKRLRWFGIDRPAKQAGIWDNDIRELGYKYQMTDVAAAMGLSALAGFEKMLAARRALLREYVRLLRGTGGLRVLGGERPGREHAAWLFTVAVERRRDFERKLASLGIESGQAHYRNDRYSIFGRGKGALPNMDALEDQYTLLPLHTRMSLSDVGRVCRAIRSGW